MTGSGDVIASSVARRDGIGSAVDRLIFGSDDPDLVADHVDEFCRRELGSDVEAYEFYAVSVQSVHGVRLVDGRRVVVKAVQPTDTGGPSVEALLAMQAVQSVLADHGFPAPLPQLGPRPIGHSVAIVESLVELDATVVDGHDPGFRRAMAETLAEVVERTSAFRSDERLRMARRPRRGSTALWPVPHSPLFDFEATADGAESIDALAAEAQRRLVAIDDWPLVVGHFDIRSENCRYDGSRIVALFDWDSLGRAPEVEAVGSVAHAFPVDWSRDQIQAPTPDEISSFIDEYAAARGAPFTGGQRWAAAACAAYSVAYTARCQHALGPLGNDNRSFIDLVDARGADLFDL